MSSLIAEGGIWPPFGTGTADLARSFLAASSILPGDPRGISRQTIATTGPSAQALLGDEDVTIYAPTAPETAQQWNFLSYDETGDEYAIGHALHPTIQRSREAHRKAAPLDTEDLDASWRTENFFPLWMYVQTITSWNEDPPEWWDLRADYAWAVRHVFTPLGASTFMEFHQIGQVWGSLPDSPEIFRLPDDFTTVESDAWSLFDRPAPPDSAS